jgi:hypothetical protein
MSATPNDGGPAFPIRFENGFYQQGMTLRDYFAAVASQGILADTSTGWPFEAYAKDAYMHADAMLAERAKTNGGSA